MDPRTFLRIEGLVVLAGVLSVYFWLDGPVWLLIVLALAPDISMLGYVIGPRIGSSVYNVFHTYTFPVALAGVGVLIDVHLAVLVALIWVGHIGADRFFGYGLKFDTGFKDTHLTTQPVPISAFKQP